MDILLCCGWITIFSQGLSKLLSSVLLEKLTLTQWVEIQHPVVSLLFWIFLEFKQLKCNCNIPTCFFYFHSLNLVAIWKLSGKPMGILKLTTNYESKELNERVLFKAVKRINNLNMKKELKITAISWKYPSFCVKNLSSSHFHTPAQYQFNSPNGCKKVGVCSRLQLSN